MRVIKYLSLLLLSGIAIIYFTFLIPTHYDVEPFTPRHGTQYWSLQDGAKIGYTHVYGDTASKKEPIIYLHGGPGGHISDEVIEAHRPLSLLGCDLYFYDQIGSGHSTRLADISEYNVDRHREDLHYIIEQLNADKVVLIGHSWGACLAMNYLQNHPDNVSRLILTGPGPILPINNELSNINPPDSLNLLTPEYSNKEANKKMYTWRNRMIDKWAYLFASKLVPDIEVDDFFTALSTELNKSTNCMIKNNEPAKGGNGYYSHIMTYRSFGNVKYEKEKLNNLATPILILRGQCDNQKWGYTQEYLDLMSNVDLKIINGVGHDISGQASAEYKVLVKEFLGRN